MDFINHTVNWCEGEIFEARIFILFGILVLLVSFLFWKYGHTPATKGFIIPLLVFTVLCLAGGISMNFSNQNRIVKFQKEYSENAEQFKEKEIQRVKTFTKMYLPLKIVMTVLIIAGLLFVLFSTSFYWKSLALVLVFMGITVIVYDHFSEERAVVYYHQIAEK